jgi:hypothetical protein
VIKPPRRTPVTNVPAGYTWRLAGAATQRSMRATNQAHGQSECLRCPVVTPGANRSVKREQTLETRSVFGWTTLLLPNSSKR